MRPSPKLLAFLAVLPTLFGFDWWTKAAARDIPVGQSVPFVDTSWFSVAWLHAENHDIAFSIPVPMPVVLAVGAVVIGVVLRMVWTMRSDRWAPAAALGMVLAGALGNWVDRVIDGSVTDFAAVSATHTALVPWLVNTFGTSTWPIFNVADAVLLIGVGFYLLAELFEPEDEPEPVTVPAG